MKAFNFRLQRLLGFRNMQEDEAIRELGLRRMALEEETVRLSGLKKEEEHLFLQWQKEVEESIQLTNLQITQEYSKHLEKLLDNQSAQCKKKKSQVDEQREVAKECWRRKKILEILKDKASHEHMQQEKINEQKIIDEMVVNTYLRKGGD